MSIPASHIVRVFPRVITGGSTDLEMNGLIFSHNPIISATAMVLEFKTARTVGDYFGLTSDEYAAAVTYFTAYDNKFTAPGSLFFARRADEDLPAWLRGARLILTLSQLKAVTDGAFVITINDTAYAASGLDFSAATSFSDIAVIIQTALAAELSGTTVTYSSLTGAYTIQSPTAGAASTISYADSPTSGTDLATLLGLSERAGAVISQGADPMTVDEQIAAVRERTENWVTFSTIWEETTENMLLWAKWASDNDGWLYVPWTTDPSTVVPTTTSDPASVLKGSGYDHTAIMYGALDYAVFLMGCVASIPWLRINGAITLAFKRQSGLAPMITDETAAVTLDAKNCNYMGNFATRNAEFSFLYSGKLTASDYVFIDPYINAIWLNNRIQVALMDGLTRTARVPYTDEGYTRVRAWMMDPVKAGLNNGVIEPGVTLSEGQRSELMNEAGLDISQELWSEGYYIQILDPGAKVRIQRESPIISLWYTYGSAIHKLDVASTAVL